MKRQFFVLLGLLVTPAIAEVSPFVYNNEYAPEYSDVDAVKNTDDETDAPKTPMKISRQPTATASRSSASRGTTSRTAPATTANASGRATSGADGRVVSARGSTNTSSRSASDSSRSVTGRTTTASRTAVSPRTTSARTTTTNATRSATTTNATRSASTAGRATAARSAVARTATTSAASTGVRTSRVGMVNTVGTINPGDALYNGSRYSVSSNVTSTSSKIGSRVPAIRVASTTTSVPENATSTADALKQMDDLAEMTDYCKAQYAACMDNYCNVLDDNQGRCSCSANLKNYAKAEAALKTATEELQDVAQKIQYIGLSSREVETLFSETEAELKMSSPDTSQIKTSLDKIKDMLIEVRTGTANSDSVATSNFGFDMNGLLDFTIDSTGFDLSSLFGGFGSTTNSVNNQRGEELYKSAVNRCKTAVLKSCTNQGVDANLVTNSYDLQIDKECVLYERSLTDSNDQMVATIRNAKNVLQKARLMVSQQKNVYDMRGCVNALDACMQDEFVCGTDYENCLDPTGRYIVNGEIVLGSQPGHAIDPVEEWSDGVDSSLSAGSTMTSDVCGVKLYETWNMPGVDKCEDGNAWGATGTLQQYIEKTVGSNTAQSISTNMSKYLQNKIGYASGGKNFGMCMSVLNKCQDYTYTGSGNNREYDQQNDVIKQYLSRVLVQIKSKQDQILSDYADSCISDVVSCLSQNNYPTNVDGVFGTTANIAINACRPTIVTCMSVNGYLMGSPTPNELASWVCGVQFPDKFTDSCPKVDRTNSGGSGGGTGSYGHYLYWNIIGGDVSDCTTYLTNPSGIVSCDPNLPDGYTFLGWYLNGNKVSDGYTVNITSNSDGNLNYTGMWECAANYDLVSNTCVERQCDATHLNNCNQSNCSDSISGYAWCPKIQNGQPGCRPSNECYSAPTADWVTISLYNKNGGSGGDNNLFCQKTSGVSNCPVGCRTTKNCTASIKNFVTPPTKTDFIFDGYLLNNSVEIVKSDSSITNAWKDLVSTQTHNAVAQWDPVGSGSKSYIYIVYNNGGHGTTPSSTSCEVGVGSITLPSALTASDWVFNGWKNEVTGEVKNANTSVQCTTNALGVPAGGTVTFTADWNQDETPNEPDYREIKFIW